MQVIKSLPGRGSIVHIKPIARLTIPGIYTKAPFSDAQAYIIHHLSRKPKVVRLIDIAAVILIIEHGSIFGTAAYDGSAMVANIDFSIFYTDNHLSKREGSKMQRQKQCDDPHDDGEESDNAKLRNRRGPMDFREGWLGGIADGARKKKSGRNPCNLRSIKQRSQTTLPTILK